MLSAEASRRNLLKVGALMVSIAVLAPPAARAEMVETSENERIVRRYYASWEHPDWGPFDEMLASDFTFTSPNGDDHISKSTFKRDCWDTQVAFIQKFDLEVVNVDGNQALVKYLCHTRNGKTFRNVEYHRLQNQKISAIECYFGASSSFASAVDSKRS